jgi:hypothetical protein
LTHYEDTNPGINKLFLNNLDPKCYAMQMKNPDVLSHPQMRRRVDADKLIDEQRPEIQGLMEIGTFEFIRKINCPPKQISRSHMYLQMQKTLRWIP